ncbi:hypothetical protein ACH5RR_022056 [Cinchona calisaya]|uniref:Uncharacterized protein n=1 Tax=Cinchona calisaya TaxID=153742 RepID=A0ABD2Z8H4_9GENT
MVTTGTPLPTFSLRKKPKSTIILIPQFLTLFTTKPSVPRNLALEAKWLLASGPRGLLHATAALVDDLLGAIPIGTMTPRISHHRRFAEGVAPFNKQIRAHQGSTSVRIKELGTIQSRAGDFGDVVAELCLDVLDHAIHAERVGPAVVVLAFEFFNYIYGFYANFAGEAFVVLCCQAVFHRWRR